MIKEREKYQIVDGGNYVQTAIAITFTYERNRKKHILPRLRINQFLTAKECGFLYILFLQI